MTAKSPLLFYCAIIFTLCACRKKEEPLKIPADVLSPDSMTIVLIDIHLIEGARLGSRIQGNDSLNVKDFYYHVWDKYHLSKKRFRRSFRFYSAHPSKIEKIYEEMLDSLNIMEASLTGTEEEEREEISDL